MKTLNLISGPRNLSTSLMYSFAQRENMKVMDEPFYGYYLKNASLQIDHPSQDEVLRAMETRPEKIIDAINSASKKTDVFVKGMAHHYLMPEPTFILDWENVLLIRRPEKLIASFAAVVPNPSLDDIGLKKSTELFLFLKNNGKPPMVMDSDELLKDPETYLGTICERLGLPFEQDMLHWKKGGIPEDGIWAKHWYHTVHNSEGFVSKKSGSRPFPKNLAPLLEEALPYYETLKNHVLLNN